MPLRNYDKERFDLMVELRTVSGDLREINDGAGAHTRARIIADRLDKVRDRIDDAMRALIAQEDYE